MKVTTVVELLLILLLVAFAAYGRVIEHDGKTEEGTVRDMRSSEESNAGISTLSLKQATDTVNRYCTCNENICNCCRDFHIPLVQLQGPGCASLQYLQGDELAVQLSFGNNILTSTIVNGKSPKPVCVPLPGGFTKFCGRIYSIKREARNNFKACLGLELQSSTEIEASLRVGCFRFGPDGVNLRPAEPLPVIEAEATEEEEDDDDLFGLGSDDDDEDEDTDYDTPLTNSATNSSTEEDEDEDDDDVLGFGALLDIITGEDETTTKKPKGTTPTPFLQFTIPILTKPTSSPVNSVSVDSNIAPNDSAEDNECNQETSNVEEESDAEEESAAADTAVNEAEEVVTVVSNKIASYAKPDKLPTKKFTALDASKKKPSITSSSTNAIENEINKKKKPPKKPVKDDDDDDDVLEDDLDDDDDDEEEEELLDSDDDDEKNSEEEDEKIDGSEQESHEDEDEKADVESLVDDDDDDDEEEDAVISALVYDEKTDGKKKGKVKKHYQTMEADDYDADYGLGLTGLLARSRHSRNSHQSKDVRL